MNGIDNLILPNTPLSETSFTIKGYGDLLVNLNKIQTELRVPKNQRNKYGNYNFRNCDDIVEAVKPLLKKYNLVLVMYDKIECINNHTYVQSTASLMDIVGHEVKVTAYAREVEEPSGILTEPMLTGSASSYARKYALNGLFALDDAKDPDDNIEPKKEDFKEKNIANKPSPKQLDIINNYLTNTNAWDKLCEYGVGRLDELTKDQASEMVAKIYKGGL